VDRAPLDPSRLVSLVGSRWRAEIVTETASTNADLLAAGAPDRVVRVAEHQSAGRGRLDRTWTSPPGAGLTVSLAVRPAVPMPTWGWLPLLTGLALRDAVAELPGLRAPVSVKWPNDLLLGDRKAAGILAQTQGGGIVVGVGLNVSTSADELPVPTATSLAVEGVRVDRTSLLGALLAAFDRYYDAWVAADGSAIGGLLTAYRAACSTLGRAVTVAGTDGAMLQGRAEDVDEMGRLVVVTEGGPQTVAAGDVEHVRPA
jgi:BirA family biotin operon repressor/biotin-[acetyl-CoA-carboxylase] ligase